MQKKPIISNIKVAARSHLFTIERLDLNFSNGQKRTFERLRGLNKDAVLIVPILDSTTLLLIKEYAVGIEDYQLGFPKGIVESGEDTLVAANREMKEEIGYGAKSLELIKTTTLAPGYTSAITHFILAKDLYHEKLIGDEPEELEVIPYNINEYEALLAHPDFTESRSIAALLWTINLLQNDNYSGICRVD